MATSQHIFPTAATPPAVPTYTYLRSEFERDDPRCLPFVRDTKIKNSRQISRSFWAFDPPPDDMVDSHSIYKYESAQGTRAAAAYLEYQDANGPNSVPLTWIVRDMEAEMGHCAIAFLSHLAEVTEAYTRMMGRREIFRWTEAVMAATGLSYEASR